MGILGFLFGGKAKQITIRRVKDVYGTVPEGNKHLKPFGESKNYSPVKYIGIDKVGPDTYRVWSLNPHYPAAPIGSLFKENYEIAVYTD